MTYWLVYPLLLLCFNPIENRCKRHAGLPLSRLNATTDENLFLSQILESDKSERRRHLLRSHVDNVTLAAMLTACACGRARSPI